MNEERIISVCGGVHAPDSAYGCDPPGGGNRIVFSIGLKDRLIKERIGPTVGTAGPGKGFRMQLRGTANGVANTRNERTKTQTEGGEGERPEEDPGEEGCL